MEKNTQLIERRRFVIPEEFLSGKKKQPALQGVSIVKEGAIQSEFIMFQKDKMQADVFEFPVDAELFKVNGEEEKQMITGVAMIPFMNILRRDKKTGKPYYGYFTPSDIELLVEGMFQYKYINNFSLNHNGKLLDDIQFLNGFIVNDYCKDSRFDVPNGSWIITCKVHNKETWNKIKEEGLTGFSIEAFLDSIEEEFSKKEVIQEDVLNTILETLVEDIL